MQKKHGLCAEFCGSRAAEEASVILWIMIDFSHDLQIISHNPRITPLVATFKGKQVGWVCGLGNLVPSARKSLFPSPLFLFSPTL